MESKFVFPKLTFHMWRKPEEHKPFDPSFFLMAAFSSESGGCMAWTTDLISKSFAWGIVSVDISGEGWSREKEHSGAHGSGMEDGSGGTEASWVW